MEAKCPRCGQTIQAGRSRGHDRWKVRAAVNNHAYSAHPGLSSRQRSLLADEAAKHAVGGSP